jgi:endonuclease YncB( thermonuclease family)
MAKRYRFNKGNKRSSSLPWILLASFVGYSIYQYSTTGQVTWLTSTFNNVQSTVGGYATRPEAGWRQAADAIESLGAKRESVPKTFDITARVVGVTDGDTVTVLEDGSNKHKIRLHGIDTPERGQPHYRQAKDALADKIAGKAVGIGVVDTDRYGRTVGVIYFEGQNINVAMVREGHAWWYRKYAQYDRQLQDAESQAQSAGLGLWQQADPVPPWEWRRNRR